MITTFSYQIQILSYKEFTIDNSPADIQPRNEIGGFEANIIPWFEQGVILVFESISNFFFYFGFTSKNNEF